jgi:hypothetical protein
MYRAVMRNNLIAVGLLASYGASVEWEGLQCVAWEGPQDDKHDVSSAWKVARVLRKIHGKSQSKSMCKLVAKIKRMQHPFYFLHSNFFVDTERLQELLKCGQGHLAIDGQFPIPSPVEYLKKIARFRQYSEPQLRIQLAPNKYPVERRAACGDFSMFSFLVWERHIQKLRSKERHAFVWFAAGLSAKFGARSMLYKVFQGYDTLEILMTIFDFIKC